jgi:hypothetical protein
MNMKPNHSFISRKKPFFLVLNNIFPLNTVFLSPLPPPPTGNSPVHNRDFSAQTALKTTPIHHARSLLAKCQEPHTSPELILLTSAVSLLSFFPFASVLQIRIRFRRIHMFLGLLDPNPDPLVKKYGSGSSYHQAKKKKNIDFYCFVASL